MIPDHPMSNRRFSPVQCIRTNRGRSCIRVTVASALLLSYSGEASIWYEVKPSYVSTICLFNSLTCSYHTLIYAVLLRQLGSWQRKPLCSISSNTWWASMKLAANQRHRTMNFPHTHAFDEDLQSNREHTQVQQKSWWKFFSNT